MDRNQAVAFIMYIQRAHSIVPTTGAEWTQLQGILTIIENVANGRVIVEVKSANPPPEVPTEAPKSE